MGFEKDNKKDGSKSIASAENLSNGKSQSLQPPPLQLKTGEEEENKTLPYQESFESAFGSHDLTGISAHTDAEATNSAESVGASSYAMGSNVGFKGAPSLNTAAHEAVHTIQQGGEFKKEEEK